MFIVIINASLFDKRIEVYSALEFLFEYKKFANINDNQRLLDRLDDNMLIINKAKFVFDENLTRQITDFSKNIYTKIIANEDVDNNSFTTEEIDNFKTNILPQIEALIKI